MTVSGAAGGRRVEGLRVTPRCRHVPWEDEGMKQASEPRDVCLPPRGLGPLPGPLRLPFPQPRNPGPRVGLPPSSTGNGKSSDLRPAPSLAGLRPCACTFTPRFTDNCKLKI